MYTFSRFCLKTFLKINIFLNKNNDYSYTFVMGHLAPGKMFDNMLQLMRFSVYLEGILNINNGYFYIKIMISAAHMVGDSWACFLGKYFEKNAIWCVLMFLCILC